MTNTELENQMRKLVRDERRITKEILVLINLADERRLFLERGFPSLFEWLVKSFGYSEGAAQRRIQAARLLRSVPETSSMIEAGAVNLTTLAKTQSIIRAQEKASGAKITMELKAQLIESITNKTAAECERTLLARFPEAASQLRQERKAATSETTTRLYLTLENESLRDLERAQDLLSHKMPGAGLVEVISFLAKEFLRKNDPLLIRDRPLSTASDEAPKSANAGNDLAFASSNPSSVPKDDVSGSSNSSTEPQHSPTTAAAAKRRVEFAAVTMSVRRAVIRRARGHCEYRDPRTGTVCGSTYQLEIDHILPRALGGSNDSTNLRCLCRYHNQWMAERVLGKTWANQWRPTRRPEV